MLASRRLSVLVLCHFYISQLGKLCRLNMMQLHSRKNVSMVCIGIEVYSPSALAHAIPLADGCFSSVKGHLK